jgi:hypothetical protein
MPREGTDRVAYRLAGVTRKPYGLIRGDQGLSHGAGLAVPSRTGRTPHAEPRRKKIQRESLEATSMTARPASRRATGTRNGLAET